MLVFIVVTESNRSLNLQVFNMFKVTTSAGSGVTTAFHLPPLTSREINCVRQGGLLFSHGN